MFDGKASGGGKAKVSPNPSARLTSLVQCSIVMGSPILWCLRSPPDMALPGEPKYI